MTTIYNNKGRHHDSFRDLDGWMTGKTSMEYSCGGAQGLVSTAPGESGEGGRAWGGVIPAQINELKT